MDVNSRRVISIAKEDVLRAIVELETSLVEEIQSELSNPEAYPEAQNQLVAEGLIIIDDQSVKLTKLGQESADVIANRHRVIEEYFLHEVTSKDAHLIAHKLEHMVSEEVVHSLKRIRALEKRGHRLNRNDSGSGLITRVGLDSIQLFDRMISMGICPGQWVTIVGFVHGGLILLIGNTQLVVGWDIISNIEVMFP
jgi:Mn-dependent DtxR family transcriptional regulator/Fe2+ transport system protein FeoA